MKIFYPWCIILLAITLYCCKKTNSSSATSLTPVEFSEKIKQTPGAVILDVRTPEEFAEGHIPEAMNVNWEGNDFDNQMSQMDKYRPVFVYCQGGGRSSEAADKMRKNGFIEVYELNGGLSNWQDAKLPIKNN